jgi:hypothetical protein
MRLVPRQLRRSDFPSSVPYYGGRLTPGVIAGLEARPTPDPAPASVDAESAGLLEPLTRLRDRGVLSEDEYQSIRQRILDGR